jgi:hypothetical protein
MLFSKRPLTLPYISEKVIMLYPIIPYCVLNVNSKREGRCDPEWVRFSGSAGILPATNLTMLNFLVGWVKSTKYGLLAANLVSLPDYV